MSQSTAQPAAPDVFSATPQKQHRWLQRLVGEWTYEVEAAQPGQPPQKATGTERVRALGDLWVVAEAKGQMPGGDHGTSIMTLGFSRVTSHFVGTWIGSMMTHMWIYDGELDAAEQVLTLTSEGPSMSGDGTMSTYQDIIELKSDGHRLLKAQVRQKDGTWQHFMTTEYRRRE